MHSTSISATFSRNLLLSVELLHKQGMTIPEIIKSFYDEYHNETETKTEVINLQKKFKKLNKMYKQKIEELTELSKEMDYMCKQMELL